MLISLLVTISLVMLNGFFVAAEFSLVKVRLSQIDLQVKSGHRRAQRAKGILEKLDSYLAATQLGITLASLGLGWIGEPVVSRLLIEIFELTGIHASPELAHQIALPVAFAIITILHIVFGELAPKSLALQRSERTALAVAYPLHWFYLIFRPFIWILNGIANVMLKSLGIEAVHGSEVHSADELKYIVKKGNDSGIIKDSDYQLIKNAMDFSERSSGEIMIHRTQVVAIDLENYDDEKVEKVIDEGYSRIPCYKGSLDNVLGVVYLKDLLLKIKRKETIDIAALMRPTIVVPDSKNIGSLLNEFQLKHQQLAIVVNEFGGMRGIVTMEDILEELVGEIQDEYDNELPSVEKTADKVYNVRATASVHEINQYLPRAIADSEYNSLAGVLMEKFGRIPNTNDKITFDGYEWTVLKRVRNSIALVQLRNIAD